MDAGVPGVEIEMHGRIAPAIRPVRLEMHGNPFVYALNKPMKGRFQAPKANQGAWRLGARARPQVRQDASRLPVS